MNEAEFGRLAGAGYNRIPIVLETFADLDTPLSIYLKLANQPYSYLLESVQGGERFGRYSFIGLPSASRIVIRGRHVAVMHGEALTEEAEVADPLDFVRQYLGRFKVAPLPGLPRFCGGLVGYFVGSNPSSTVSLRSPIRWAHPTRCSSSPKKSRSSTISRASSTSLCSPIPAIRLRSSMAASG
jgi:hypothetical protein